MENQTYRKSNYYLNTQNKNTESLLENSMYDNLINKDIVDFHKSLPGYQETPLYELKSLAKALKVQAIFVKDESARFGLNAFKGLGASYAVSKIIEKNPNQDNIMFCTATDGNHGKALAWSAKVFKQRATIFVPYFTTESRKNNILSENADVVVCTGHYDETVQEAFVKSEMNGWTYVQDTSFDNYTEIPLYIMTGYQTLIIEIEKILQSFDFIFLQVGVGSYAASIMYYLIKERTQKAEPVPKIIVVEPLEADCCLESAKNKSLSVSRGSGETIMAGLNCMTPSMIAFPIMKDGADLFLAIDDFYAIKAMNLLYYPTDNDPKIISGESGAAGLAGLLALLEEDELSDIRSQLGLGENSTVLVINTEGATDYENFEKIVKIKK